MHLINYCKVLVFVLIGFFMLACQSSKPLVKAPMVSHPGHPPVQHDAYSPPLGIRTSSIAQLDPLISELAAKQIIYIGELHGFYHHHLNQLEIIKRLHALNPKLAIGLEYFQIPYQQYLDQYVAGDISEQTMLEKTEYYQRWRYDYRHYRPILSFAKERKIPLIALNAPDEVTSKVAHIGIDRLTAEEKQYISTSIDRSDQAYRKRLREVFEKHPRSGMSKFEYFADAQYVWDETMAEQAVGYLLNNPGTKLVVLAGAGHLAYGSGIPKRVSRRLPASSAIVLHDDGTAIVPEKSDFLLFSSPVHLPPNGKLGIFMNNHSQGVSIAGFSQDSAAKEEGLKVGDRIISLAGQSVKKIGDIKLIMLDKKPGEMTSVTISRKNWFGMIKEYTFQVELKK